MDSLAVQFHYSTEKLRDILTNVFLTPEVLHKKDFFDFDQGKVSQYKSILSSINHVEILKVWESDNGTFLIDNYEYWKALHYRHKDNVDAEIPCLKISGSSLQQVKSIALKLKTLRTTEAHISRCVNMKILIDSGFDTQSIKRIYGIEKSSSATSRQFQRDHQLIRYPEIFSRVLGVDTTQDVKTWLSPQSSLPSLQYGLALTIISKLPDERKFVKRFDDLYSEYLAELQESRVFDDELSKPIFNWSRYNKNHVLDLAGAVARHGKSLSYSTKLFRQMDDLDQKWSIDHNEKTHSTSIPNIQLNLQSKDDANLKKVVEVIYKTEKLHYSLLSYFKRINPTAHGQSIRLQSSDIAPVYETSANTFKFEDTSYFDFVRKYKILRYCNRELLLKSIGLKAHHFGFQNYRSESSLSYSEISLKFNEFRKKKSLVTRSGTQHSQIDVIYSYIDVYLAFRSSHLTPVPFSEFINDLFSEVFNRVDDDKEAVARKTKLFRTYGEAISGRDLLNQIDNKESVTVSPEEARALASHLYQADYDRLTKVIENLTSKLEELGVSK